MPKPKHKKPLYLLTTLTLYTLSSGPVMATAFALREATGFDAFYNVMWLYAPILILPRWIWDGYLEWWVERFGTVSPG